MPSITRIIEIFFDKWSNINVSHCCIVQPLFSAASHFSQTYNPFYYFSLHPLNVSLKNHCWTCSPSLWYLLSCWITFERALGILSLLLSLFLQRSPRSSLSFSRMSRAMTIYQLWKLNSIRLRAQRCEIRRSNNAGFDISFSRLNASGFGTATSCLRFSVTPLLS